jgi:hypothetical protein
MSDADSARWNAWLDKRVVSHIESFAKMLGKEIGLIEKEIKETLLAEMDKRIHAVKFPKVKGYTPRTHLEGEVVVFGGGCYQALRDTGLPPGSNDCIVLACPGAPGVDGRDARSDVIDLPKWPRGKRSVA